MRPKLQGIDHIHVYVSNREEAEKWYEEVLGFRRISALERWADEEQGPLTLEDAGGSIHVALFERSPQPNRATIALKTSGEGLFAWKTHLSNALETKIEIVDHELSWSIYFSDPYGNPYEITTYEYEWVASHSRC